MEPLHVGIRARAGRTLSRRAFVRPAIAALVAAVVFSIIYGGFTAGPVILTMAVTFVGVFALQALRRRQHTPTRK